MTTPASQRAQTIACAVALLAGLASLVLWVQPDYDARSDAALYLATARSLANGDGYQFLGAPFTLRPPGFPALLAPVFAWRGLDFQAIHTLVGAFGLACVSALFAWARPTLGPWLALATAAVVWVNPGFQRLCNSAMSDVPGAALLLGALLAERHARARPSLVSDFWVALLCAAAFWVRPMNGLLLPAIALGRALRWREAPPEARRQLVARTGGWLLLAALLMAPWIVWSSSLRPDGAVEQTKLHSFETAMFRADPGDPSSRALTPNEILGRAPTRARQLVAVLGSQLGTTIKGRDDDPLAEAGAAAPDAGIATVLLGLAMLAALCASAWRQPDAGRLTALAAVAVLLVYYGFQERLALPIYLIALPCTIEGARRLSHAAAARVAPGQPGAAATAAGALVLLAALVIPFGSNPRAAIAERSDELMTLRASLDERLEAGEVLAAGKGFHLTVLLDRPVLSLHHIVRRDPEQGLDRAIDEHGIDAIVLDRPGRTGQTIEKQLRARIGPPERLGHARFWRIERDAVPGSRATR